MKLAVRYFGVEAERGRMGALELGPAIMGLGEMVGQASRVLYGDATRVRLEVKADFHRSAFGIEFFAVSSAAGLLPPLSLQDLAAIAGILGFGVAATTGLVQLLRWQRGRKIDRVDRVGDEYHITINDESRNVTVNEYNVFIDPQIRKGFNGLIAPLEREGVDSISVQAGDDPPAVIEKPEYAPLASAPLPEEEVSLDRYTAVLEIVSPSFRESYKWRFSQGAGVFFADIVDQEFLAQVAKHSELFGSGDALRAEVEVRTTRTEEGFSFTYTILHVLEHIPADRGCGQLPLV